MSTPRLLTIPMSHYCEKARWALDRLGVVHEEVRQLQGFHYALALWWARSPTVPVLRIDGRVLRDSTAILHELDARVPAAARLYPEEPALRREVEQLAASFDAPLGVDTRLWIYHGYFTGGHLADILATAAQGAPPWQARAMPWLFPVVRRFLEHRLGGLSRERVDLALARSRAAFAGVAARLADGRRYLCGDSFTAADLTFACMGAPLVLPPEYGIPLPTPAALPAAMRPVAEEMRAHPAGAFILRLFRDERHRVHPACAR